MLRAILDYFFGSSSRSQADESAGPMQESDTSTTVLEPPGAEITAPLAGKKQSADEDWWIPRGAPVLTAPSAGEKLASIDSSLYSQLNKIFDDPNVELPQLPQVSQQVLLMLRDENVVFTRVADVIQQDSVLTAEILRIANSVAFRGMREINRLGTALARLGVRNIRSMILSVSLKAMAIRTGGPQKSIGEELWRRSLASAVVASEIGPWRGLPREDAFLIGLLHDIGMMVVLKVVHDFQGRTGRKVTRQLFDALCERWHEHLGARLAGAWNLPDPLPVLISDHHREPSDEDPLAVHRRVLTVTDVICSMLEFSPYVPFAFFSLPAVQKLQLDDEESTWAVLRRLAQKVSERLDG